MNIALVDKSVFQTKYLWEEGDTLLDKITRVEDKCYTDNYKINAIVCYLDRVEYESFCNFLPREVVIFSGSFSKLPKELEPMCKRWIQYGGIYFMEER